MISKKIMLSVLLAVALVVGSSVGQAADKKTKIGFVYVGPIGDHGWSYQHNVGRLAINNAFGDKVKTTYVESVPEGASLPGSNHVDTQIILILTFGFTERAAKKVALIPLITSGIGKDAT